MRQKLQNIGFDNDLLDMSPKVQETRGRKE